MAEKIGLTRGALGAAWGGRPRPERSIGSAGFVPGVARLGVPDLQETDGELGIANPGDVRRSDTATAMPSNLALASSFDTELAFWQGQIVGAEARARGFNAVLGGAANLIRDPRGGRNFEYFSEDPLLTGVLAGKEIAGIQSQHVISTVKHFALNDQETDRVVLDANIDRSAARESDLFAFELAIETGDPGSVMCAYNMVNGQYSCENDWLLTEVLRHDWGFKGFVMSDWGAVHSTARAALAGLDQELGEQLDTQTFFGDALAAAVDAGEVPVARVDEMARRILTSLFRFTDSDAAPHPHLDLADSDRVALRIAREGIVLLKNQDILPLAERPMRVVVIGAHADLGVPAGGGSSQVTPRGGYALLSPTGPNRAEAFDPSSPVTSLRQRFPRWDIAYDDGLDVRRAAELAAGAGAVIVFADKWMTETADATDISLPRKQDQLIAAITAANPRTVVVLETGGAVRHALVGRRRSRAGGVVRWSERRPGDCRRSVGGCEPFGPAPHDVSHVGIPVATSALARRP